FDLPLYAVYLAFLRFAVCAVLGVDLFVLEPYGNPGERQLLRVRIEAYGHRGACAERSEQEIVRTRARIGAARCGRLVGAQPVPAGGNLLRELAFAGLGDSDQPGFAAL